MEDVMKNKIELTYLSKKRLSTCELKLQILVAEINKQMFVNVSIGNRSKAEQDKAFNEGKSKLRYPHSKHNETPAKAVDIYPIVDNKIAWDKFDELGLIIKEVADRLNICITWGGDWANFVDKPHIELK